MDDDVAAAVESEGQDCKHDEHRGNARSSSGNNSILHHRHHHHHHLVVVVAGWLLLVPALFLSTHPVERLVFGGKSHAIRRSSVKVVEKNNMLNIQGE
jgi:hypothetical protein